MIMEKKVEDLSEQLKQIEKTIEKHYNKCPIKMDTVQLYAEEMERNRRTLEELSQEIQENMYGLPLFTNSDW